MSYICWKCSGKKQVLSTGCMFRECTECKGVGYTKEKKLQAVSQPASNIAVDDELVIDTSVIDTTTSIQALEFKATLRDRQDKALPIKTGKPRKRSITESNVMASDILKSG